MSHALLRLVTMWGLLLATGSVTAEQMQRFGAWEVHYVVLPSGFLKPDVATRYRIVRGRDRSFVNVSVLDGEGKAAEVAITGATTNLLEQRQALKFREVIEGSAVYYLAEIKHSDEEVLRFDITLTPANERPMVLRFQQKLYWEEP